MERKRHIHVELTSDEFDRLVALRDSPIPQKWRAWFFSIQDQFRILHERVELFKLKAENAERERDELKERVIELQRRLGE